MEGGDGYYIDSNGDLVVEGDMDTAAQRLQPYYLAKIQQYYNNSSSEPANFLSKLYPLDVVAERQRSSALREWNSTIMKIAPSVVSVSTFGGVNRVVDCSGIVLDWNEITGEATILTSAKLIKIPHPDDRQNYFVAVRLQNGDIHLAHEDYVDFYHNILLLKIQTREQLKLVSLEDSHPGDSTDVIALGRDFFGTFVESKGVLYLEYPYFGCQELVSTSCEISEVYEGGPLITKSGSIVGINFHDSHCYAHPLPSSIIKQCLDLWSSRRIVKQPWVGLTVIDAHRLSNDGRQKLSLNPDFGGAVIVKEVFEGSLASKLGVRPGDLVRSCNNREISSTSEYSTTMCELSKNMSEMHACESPARDDLQVMLQIQSRGSDRYLTLKAEMLDVDDISFFSCWPAVDSQQFRSLRFGSQTDYPLGMICRPDPPSWLVEIYRTQNDMMVEETYTTGASMMTNDLFPQNFV